MRIPTRLDKSRPSGQHFPPLKNEKDVNQIAHFEQDGFQFDNTGKLLTAWLTPEQKKAWTAQAKPPDQKKNEPAGGESEQDGAGGESAGAETAGEDAVQAPMTRGEIRRQEEENKRHAGSDDLNLNAWLRGDEKYPEFRVKKVVRDRFSRVFDKIGDLVEFLVTDENIEVFENLKPEFKAILTAPAQAGA